MVLVVVVMTTVAVATAVATATAGHQQVVGRHLHGHYVLGERPDHLSELVDLVAQVPHAVVTFVQPLLQPGDVLVLLPGFRLAALELAFQVPQPVHHGRTHDGGDGGAQTIPRAGCSAQ